MRFTMLDNETIKTIELQIPKVRKVIKIGNCDQVVFVKYGGKAIEVTLNNLDLFDIRFLKGSGGCYNLDKTKTSISNIDLFGFENLFKKV